MKITLETDDLSELNAFAATALAIRDAYHLSYDVVTSQQGRKHKRQLELPIGTPQERLRALAKTRGALWTHQTLTATGVKRLADLTEAQVEALLNAG